MHLAWVSAVVHDNDQYQEQQSFLIIMVNINRTRSCHGEIVRRDKNIKPLRR